MKRILPPILLFLMISLSAQSQQIEIGSRGSEAGQSYLFNNRFLPEEHYDMHYRNLDIYKLYKIKKIILFNEGYPEPYYSLELDTNGQVLQTGRSGKGRLLFITEQHMSDSMRHTDTTIKSYFRQSKLMRKDTIIQTYYTYNNSDTLIKFTRTQLVSYWNGTLLNERNAYDNEHFLHKVLQKTLNGPFWGPHNISYQKKVFLHHRLKTNFDTSTIYLNQKEAKDEDFSASIAEKKYLSPQQLSKHPFVRKYKNKGWNKFYTNGGDFEEPFYYFPNTACGTTTYLHEYERAHTEYDYSKNSDGLYETYYSEYNNPYIDGKQTNTSSRCAIFYYRYEYFKN